LIEASLNIETNKWKNVEDFNWLKSQKSPNWDLIPSDQLIQNILPKIN
jgi:hypothetical protein